MNNEINLEWQKKVKRAIANIQGISRSFKELSKFEGLTAAEIVDFENELKVRFPKDYRGFLTVYGKTLISPKYKEFLVYMPLFGDFGLMNKEQIIAQWHFFNEKMKINKFNVAKTDLLWNPKLIPIASNNSHRREIDFFQFDYLVLDENSEHYGKILEYNQTDFTKIKFNFKEYIEDFFIALEGKSGLLTWDETYGFSF